MTHTSFGLIAWLSSTRIQLPLVHVETQFRVTGEVVVVEMEQVFEQTARESLDVTYSFPLPGSPAVFRCEMIINDRVVRAVVMEQQEARRVVAEKKAAGHRTALVEMERDNLFTLQLGNAAPGDTIVIRLAYMETLERLGTQLSLRIPFSPGVRYIPGKPLLRANSGRGSADDTDQVPDASRLTPPRITRAHPDAATVYVHGVFDADEITTTTVASPTHAAVIFPQGGKVEVELAQAEEAPDRDFVLRWEEKAALEPQPRAWVSAQGGETHALLQLRAPQAADAAVAGDDHAQDIYFLLDRSGSMQGVKWQMCAQALHAFVRELGARDRVWITCFGSYYQDFAEKLMTRDELLADRGFRTLARLGTSGGTELQPALEHVLKLRQTHSASQTSRLILITDGQVGNEPAILKLMKKPAHAALPVHCFGIDDAVNDAFLKNLARQTGGRCALMTPKDDIPAAVRALAVSLRRPVLTDLRLEGDGSLPNEGSSLAELHAGEVILVPLRLAEGQPLSAAITARRPDGSAWRQTFDLHPSAEASSTAAPRLLWARGRINHLIEQGRQSDAVQVAIAHNLTCDGASFVAWDEAEKVSVARREVYQPSFDAIAVGAMGMGENMFEGLAIAGGPCLRDCSDDDLLGEAPACAPSPLALRKRASFSRGIERSTSLAEMSPGPSPCTPISGSDALNEITFRYGSWAKVENSRLAAWALSFRRLLTSAGMPLDSATALTIVLNQWGLLSFFFLRRRHLEKLLTSLQGVKAPLADLRPFIQTHLASPLLEDALCILDLCDNGAPVPAVPASVP
ncbi:MAG: VIT domain-containing protein [Prosthecobacter sp.]